MDSARAVSYRGDSMPTKVREITRVLLAHGWREMDTKGSHRHFKHPVKPGKVTVAGKPGIDLPEKTLRSILKQAGLTREDLR
jgi:predicted RNA binding protein YcfA (HicA-like mRNA interferase family)